MDTQLRLTAYNPSAMTQRIAQFAVTVRDYDEALAFYVNKLGFELLEDTDLGGGKQRSSCASIDSRMRASATWRTTADRQ